MQRVAPFLALLLTGCSCVEVRIVDDAEGGGGAASTAVTGGAEVGGAPAGGAPVGGAPVGGGPLGGADPGLVPGCEALVWSGDPITIPGYQSTRFIHFAALDSGDVGVVFRDHDNEGTHLDVMRSTVLAQPFAAPWPPAVAPVVDQHFGQYFNEPGTFSALPDGTFALGEPIHGLFRFDAAGAIVELPPGVDLFLDPAGGGWGIEGGSTLRHWDAAWSPGPVVTGFDPAPCSFRPRLARNGSTTLLASWTYWGCWESEPAIARTFALTPAQALETTDLGLAFYPRKAQLVPRQGGGFYLNLSTDGLGDPATAGQLVARLDDTGALVAPIDVPPAEAPPFANRDLASWREGFVMTDRSAAGIGVTVSDETHFTTSERLDLTLLTESVAELALLASPTGQFVLLALPSFNEVLIARAECHSFE